jgi:hypothetical protein
MSAWLGRLTLGLLLLFSPSAYSQCNQCKELIEALRLNSSGIRTYDVLVELDSSVVGEKSEQEHKQSWSRLMFDAENRMAIGVRSEEKGSSDGSLSERAIATVVNENSLIDVVPGKNDRVRKTKSFQGGMTLAGVFSLELVGIQFFPPLYYDAYSEPNVDAFWAQLSNRALEKGKILDLGDEVSFAIYSVSVQNPQVEYVSQFEFDSTTRMPNSTSLYIRNSADPTKTRKQQFERYKWFLYEGFYLPHKIMGDELRNPLPNETEPAIRDTQVRFYWLSVNKPLNKEFLAPAYWQDPSHIRDATSAKLSKRSLNPEK